MDGKKKIGTVRSRKPDGTVTEAGQDGHGTVTVSGQKRKIYCIYSKNIDSYRVPSSTVPVPFSLIFCKEIINREMLYL